METYKVEVPQELMNEMLSLGYASTEIQSSIEEREAEDWTNASSADIKFSLDSCDEKIKARVDALKLSDSIKELEESSELFKIFMDGYIVVERDRITRALTTSGPLKDDVKSDLIEQLSGIQKLNRWIFNTKNSTETYASEIVGLKLDKIQYTTVLKNRGDLV